VPYDALLKELLHAFFAEFMQRFFPEQAARLDLRQATFLEQETATDVGRGRRRVLDLVVQVRTREGEPKLILIHVELQARPEAGFPWRMFDYYGMLRRRYRIPVLPIVLYVTGGQGTETWEEYEEECLDERVVTFRYRRLRLRSLKAREAVAENDPLVAALAVLMDRRGANLAVLKATSLDRIAQARLDEARQWLLVNFVETYLPLPADAEERYQELLAREEHRMAKQAQVTWGDRIREEARSEERLRVKRDAVLTVLRERFERLPDAFTEQIEQLQSEEVLDTLLRRAVRAANLAEIQAALPN
jgi:hypothetical protein